MNGEPLTRFLFILCGFLFTVKHGSFVSYNRTYNGYTYILPLQSSNDGKGQVTYSPLINNSSGAQRWCSSHFNGSKLSTIKSEAIQKNINDFIAGAKQEKRVFGLTEIRVGGKLQNALKWVNGKIFQGDKEAQLQPDIYLTNNKFEKAIKNVESFYYICERSITTGGSCQFSHSGRCYFVTNTSARWTAARKNCTKEGGDLASLDIFGNNTTCTLDAFVRKMSLVTNFKYWVGLIKDSFWHWDDSDHEMNYTNWQFDQTSQKGECLSLHFPNNKYQEKGKWNASACAKQLPFICEIQMTDSGVQHEASSPTATTIALSICLTISVIIAIALAVVLVVKHHIWQSETSCPPIRDNKYSSSASKTKSKDTTGSNTSDNTNQGTYANWTTDENSTNVSVHQTPIPPLNTENSSGDNQQQSTIYASVQTRGGNFAPPRTKEESSSAAAADKGKLIYSEVEFNRPPKN